MSACGDDGSVGPAGPPGTGGPPGPPGPPGGTGGVPVDSAETINITVDSVTVPAGGGAPVVSFRLSNDLNQGLVGLPADDARFVLSQLSPPPAGSGASSEWQSYVTRASGGIPDAQASTERGSAGTFVDNNDGTYQYTFASALTAYPAGPEFDESKTHRLGIEIRNQAPITGNGIFDFVPAGGAPTFTRLIVDNDTCDACHDVLNFHGGPRTDVTYCVACHNPSSIDGTTGNTVDFKRLIHNIHSARADYEIEGHEWSEVEFPQDIRNCTTCHEEDDADTPDASNYRLVSNRAACGTCHYDDGIAGNVSSLTGRPLHDYAIEDGVHPVGFTFTDDTQCVDCHGPTGTVTNSEGRLVQVPVAHEVRTITAAAAFQFNIVSVAGTGVGEFPTVTFSVTDPTNADAPYNIQTDAPFTDCSGASRLSVNVAWSTTDYTNRDSGVTPALPVQMNPLTACGGTSTDNGDGTFTVTSATAIPATAVGSASVAIEGHPALNVEGDLVAERIAVTNAIEYAPITDAAAVPRRSVVNIDKCDDCHFQLSLHGNNRTDKPEVCVTCHNPNMTDIARRAGGNCLANFGPDDQTIDFKRMIHAIHGSGHDGGDYEGVPFQVCGFGSSAILFEVGYPGRLNNCEGCHLEDTYYPVDPASVLGTTMDAGADLASPTDDVVTSPNTAVCSACHTSDLAAQHMIQNGGDFGATKAADSTLISSGVETCQLCHGPGRLGDVKTMHGVGTFQFN
jgi:OmcA/MtrC family decaheme c-type cytochrome